jgi:tetratricopeptide (TPR) repeat protein
MSLLMDALKRAEKARQAQTEKQTRGAGAPTSESEFTLDPIDEKDPRVGKTRERRSAPQRASADAGQNADEAPPSSASDAVTTHFSLSDDLAATEKMPRPEPVEDHRETEKLGPFSLVRDNELSLEDTAEMLPVVREAEKSLNEYFENPGSGAPVSGDNEENVEAEDPTVLSGPAARESESRARRSARSVFDAKAPAIARHQRHRTLIIALPLLLVAVIGTGMVLFWDQLEQTFFGAPPVFVQRAPQATEVASAPQATPVAEAATLTSTSEAASAGQPLAEKTPGAELAESAPIAPESAAPVADRAAESIDAEASDSRPVAKAAAAAPVAGRFQGVAAQPSTVATPTSRPTASPPAAASVGRPYAASDSGGIRISRRSKADRVHAGINEAYLAFQRGDDAAARALYSEVVRQHPNNRNALLGLGAVAVRGGNYADAVAHYAHLLSVDPRDPIARAALINLNQQVPANEGEGHVKRLLAEDSNQPFLYFTLGNLYARRGRWLEAQQAYFDAYRLDSNSADFAFNLAVSLDRLGQTASALRYYHRALELAANGVASFEPGTAQLRIDRLRGAGAR